MNNNLEIPADFPLDRFPKVADFLTKNAIAQMSESELVKAIENFNGNVEFTGTPMTRVEWQINLPIGKTLEVKVDPENETNYKLYLI